MIIRTVAEWFQLYTFTNMLKPIFVLINLGSIGFLVFPMVAITLEELVMRSNPYYLVTVQVLCTIGSQGFAAMAAQFLSSKFEVKSKQNALECQFIICVIFSALLLMHMLTLYASKKENKRGSFILRKAAKEESIKRKEELRRQTAEIALSAKQRNSSKSHQSKTEYNDTQTIGVTYNSGSDVNSDPNPQDLENRNHQMEFDQAKTNDCVIEAVPEPDDG